MIVNAAYPAGDVLLLALLAGALTLGGVVRSRSWWLLAVSFAAQVASNGAYLHSVSSGTYVAGSVADAGWFVAPLALVCAACVRERPSGPAVRWRWHAQLTSALCGSTAIALLLAGHFDRVATVPVLLAAFALVLVMVRLGLAFRDERELLDVARSEAMTDALTGLANRRVLLADLEQAALDRTGGVLALFDLNGFKRYNDVYGHSAGDDLLRRLGGRLQDVCRREGMTAYRLGGDEFCLLATCPPSDAERLTSRGQAALAEAGGGFTRSRPPPAGCACPSPAVRPPRWPRPTAACMPPRRACARGRPPGVAGAVGRRHRAPPRRGPPHGRGRRARPRPSPTRRCEQASAEVAVRHAEGQAGTLLRRTCWASASIIPAGRSSWSARS